MQSNLEPFVRETYQPQKKSWFTNWKFITTAVLIVITLLFAALSYYQLNHFNTNVKINSVGVGGMTANQALKKLQTLVQTNIVSIGYKQIIDGKDTKMGFSEKDLLKVKRLIKKQYTFFPSSKSKEYSLMPSIIDNYRSEVLKRELEQKLITMNQSLEAPVHSHASLEKGKVVFSKGKDGTQYDVDALVSEYEKQGYSSDIHLEPIYLSANKEDSEMVKNEVKRLEEFLQHTVEYKVQDKVYELKASELIQNATLSGDRSITIDPSNLKTKIAEINDTQSTLGKDFTFKTHSGSVIKVKGQGYGWALDVEEETARIHAAFEREEKSISASSIYGNGWSNEGYGYDTTANNGIGDTYAEVSIQEQRIWLYRDGKLVLTTNVVTGKHSTGEDTSPGVWYVLYKRTPYTLTGSSSGNPNYSILVDYWAPFTNSGQGFHDASWRSNWGNKAYLTDGSGGCVNVSPSVMKAVYENLSTYEPVVIY